MRTTTRTVVLCGDSIVMSSIGASCRRAGLQVVALDTHHADPAEQLRHISPDVILYDLPLAPASLVLKSLAQDTRRLVIGVDLDRDCMLVLSGQHERAITTSDLVRVIENWRNSTKTEEGGKTIDQSLDGIIARETSTKTDSSKKEKPK